MHPVGVYFSPTTRNYFTKDFLNSYQGAIILLLQHHVEYQVVTPRTAAAFRGETLVLPDVRMLSPEEKIALTAYVESGGKLVITGENATGLGASQRVIILPDCPGKAHLAAVEKDMTVVNHGSEQVFFSGLATKAELQVEAPPLVATQIASVDGKPHIFLANFTGLEPRKNAKQTPVAGVKIRFAGTSRARLTFLPFLGEAQSVEGKRIHDGTVFVLPSIEKGAVAWIEPAK